MAATSRSVFITGATGLVGGRILDLLREEAYQVTALVRSTAAAASIAAKGATPFVGDVGHPEPIAQEAAKADAVIHLAYDHDFTKRQQALANELSICKAFVLALKGTNKSLIVTTGLSSFAPTSKLVNESVRLNPDLPSGRSEVDDIVLKEGVQAGVRSMVIRLPTHVWGPGRTGGTSQLANIQAAAVKRRGEPCYIGSGDQGISAVHVDDAATLYVLALKHGQAGDIFHVSGQDDVTPRGISEAIGKGLGMNKPAVSISANEGKQLWGPFLGSLFGASCQADATKARTKLGWQPKHTDGFYEGIAAAGAAGKLGVLG